MKVDARDFASQGNTDAQNSDASYVNDARAVAIAEDARRLVDLRDRWLSPPDFVVWVEERVAEYPKWAVPTKAAPVRELGRRTLTNLCDEWSRWLADAHAQLDAEVAEAYGFAATISDEEILYHLLKTNMDKKLS